MTDLIPHAARATAIVAIGKALVEAANDFGEGVQIAGDAWKLAEAALDAAAPVLRAADAETIAKLKQRLEASWSREDKAGMDLIIMYGRTADLRAALARAEQITDNRDREIDVLRNRLAALETP
jgi:hypothetical protein